MDANPKSPSVRCPFCGNNRNGFDNLQLHLLNECPHRANFLSSDPPSRPQSPGAKSTQGRPPVGPGSISRNSPLREVPSPTMPSKTNEDKPSAAAKGDDISCPFCMATLANFDALQSHLLKACPHHQITSGSGSLYGTGLVGGGGSGGGGTSYSHSVPTSPSRSNQQNAQHPVSPPRLNPPGQSQNLSPRSSPVPHHHTNRDQNSTIPIPSGPPSPAPPSRVTPTQQRSPYRPPSSTLSVARKFASVEEEKMVMRERHLSEVKWYEDELMKIKHKSEEDTKRIKELERMLGRTENDCLRQGELNSKYEEMIRTMRSDTDALKESARSMKVDQERIQNLEYLVAKYVAKTEELETAKLELTKALEAERMTSEARVNSLQSSKTKDKAEYDANLRKMEKEYQARLDVLSEKETLLRGREEDISAKEQEIMRMKIARDEEHARSALDLEERVNALRMKEAELLRDMELKEADLGDIQRQINSGEGKKQDLEARERALSAREVRVESKAAQLMKQEEVLKQWEERLGRQEESAASNSSLSRREREVLEEKIRSLESTIGSYVRKTEELQHKNELVRDREVSILRREPVPSPRRRPPMSEVEARVAVQDEAILSRERELERRERDLQRQMVEVAREREEAVAATRVAPRVIVSPPRSPRHRVNDTSPIRERLHEAAAKAERTLHEASGVNNALSPHRRLPRSPAHMHGDYPPPPIAEAHGNSHSVRDGPDHRIMSEAARILEERRNRMKSDPYMSNAPLSRPIHPSRYEPQRDNRARRNMSPYRDGHLRQVELEARDNTVAPNSPGRKTEPPTHQGYDTVKRDFESAWSAAETQSRQERSIDVYSRELDHQMLPEAKEYQMRYDRYLQDLRNLQESDRERAGLTTHRRTATPRANTSVTAPAKSLASSASAVRATSPGRRRCLFCKYGFVNGEFGEFCSNTCQRSHRAFNASA